MVQLICRKVEEIKDFDDFPGFARRTKTVCLYTRDRPNLASKDIVRITITKNGQKKSEIFCVDARGSKSGHLTAHPAHLKLLGVAEGETVEVQVDEANSEDCVFWLRHNADPERKAMGLILNEAIRASEKAEENLNQARLSEKNAKAHKDRSFIYAAAAFIFGTLLDIGMIEEKFGVIVPPLAVLVFALFAVALFFSASTIVRIVRKILR